VGAASSQTIPVALVELSFIFKSYQKKGYFVKRASKHDPRFDSYSSISSLQAVLYTIITVFISRLKTENQLSIVYILMTLCFFYFRSQNKTGNNIEKAFY